MDDFDDFVHENNNLILQTFCRLCELPDATETKHKLHSLALSVEVEAWVNLDQGSRNNAGTQFSETPLQQSAYLENCELQHLCFHLVSALLSLHWVHRLLQWVLSQCLNDLHNLLDRFDHNLLRIIAKHNEGSRQHDTCENSRAKLEYCLLPLAIRLVDSCVRDEVFTAF